MQILPKEAPLLLFDLNPTEEFLATRCVPDPDFYRLERTSFAWRAITPIKHCNPLSKALIIYEISYLG
jgi:hypothetical protein